MPTRLELYKKQRRRFAFSVYGLGIVFCFIGLAQWYLLWIFKEAHAFFNDNHWACISFFLVSIFVFTLFVFFEELRFIIPLNWAFTLVIVEGVILAMCLLVVKQREKEMLFEYLVWLAVVIVAIIIGSVIPHDLTLDVVILFVLAVIAVISSVFFIVVYLVLNVNYTFLAYRIFIVLTVAMFTMYHAQIINGGRFAEMRVADVNLGALIIFFDFILVYLLTFQSAPRWSDRCDKNRNITSWLEFRRAPGSNYYIASDPYSDAHI